MLLGPVKVVRCCKREDNELRDAHRARHAAGPAAAGVLAARRAGLRDAARTGRSRRCGCWARTSCCSARRTAAGRWSAGSARTAASTCPTGASRTAACAASTTAGSTAPTAAAASSPPSRSTAGSTRRSASRATRARSATGSSSPTSAAATRRRSRHYDCFRRARGVHLRVQGPVGVQLAAGTRGRHRPEPRVVPAPVPRTRTRARRTGSSSARRSTAPGSSCRARRRERTGPTSRSSRRRTGCGSSPCGSSPRSCATCGHQPAVPQRVRGAVRQQQGVLPVARAGRRREPLLVHDPLRLRRAAPTRRRCWRSGSPG